MCLLSSLDSTKSEMKKLLCFSPFAIEIILFWSDWNWLHLRSKCAEPLFVIPTLNAWVSYLLSEKYDYVGRLLKPGDEPSEYTDEEDIKDHVKHDWAVPSHRPKPGAPNSCDRLLLPTRPPPPLLPPLPSQSTCHSFTKLPALHLLNLYGGVASLERLDSRQTRPDLPPSSSCEDYHQQKAIENVERGFLLTATCLGEERGCAIRCICTGNKSIKYFSRFPGWGACGLFVGWSLRSSLSAGWRLVSGVWNTLVRDDQWTGWGNIFLFIFGLVTSFTTETTLALDSVSINHFWFC